MAPTSLRSPPYPTVKKFRYEYPPMEAHFLEAPSGEAVLAGSDWPMFATVSPHLSGPSHGHNGDDICRSYVGNSGIGDWTCLAVPYVYDVDEGADIRPNWTSCDAYHGSVFDEYEWFDSSDCTGMLMACCVHE